MKKVSRLIMLAILLVLLDGCGKNKGITVTPSAIPTPSPQPVATLTPDDVTDDENSNPDPQQSTNSKLLEYYPMQSDVEYVYEGKGNEYAAYNRNVDYINSSKNTIQTRTNNGGTETVEVIQIKDGKLTVLYRINECYYRDNLMDKTLANKDQEVLLMEPLEKGTKWTLADGTKRYISATDVKVDTPSGQYKAIEVTSQGKDSISKYYYAPKVGLVKEVFGSGDNEVSSTLSKINTKAPFNQMIRVYYPDSNEKIHEEQLPLSFHTNDATRLILEKTLRQKAKNEDYLPLVSTNTKINSMYKGKNDIAYVDFSQELIEDMNVGSGFEALVLQCITNTIGNYYDVKKVYITVGGKLYESGHIVMKKGETFKVNMSNVVSK